VLELDVHAGAELFEIETIPVDADRVADAAGLLGCGALSRYRLDRFDDFERTRMIICPIARMTAEGVIQIGASRPLALAPTMPFTSGS
jgi:hypothetical protein